MLRINEAGSDINTVTDDTNVIWLKIAQAGKFHVINWLFNTSI